LQREDGAVAGIQPLAGHPAEADGVAGQARGGAGAHCSPRLISPQLPLGRYRVTRMNSPPRTNSQHSGTATATKRFRPSTRPAPSSGPIRLPRPPRATHTAASMELVGDISEGLMMPTCGTYSAPARPHSTALSTQMNSL